MESHAPNPLNLLDAAGAPDILTAALRYQAQGLTVLPVLKGEKKSGLTGWQNLQPTAADLRRYYGTGKYGGIALRPGARSHNLVMLDLDGEAVYTAFCARFPALVDTYTERSGSGKGFHKFYQVDHLPSADRTPGIGTKIARKGIFDTDDLGFEMFYDSGAVVVAPSIHPSGNPYTVEKPLDVLRVADLDDVVMWALALDDKASRQRRTRKPRADQYTHTPTGNSDLPADLLRDIEQALGVKGYKHDGWSNPIRCVLKNHQHDDTNPAAAWNGEKHIYSCLKCGITDMLALDTARAVNIDIDRFYDDLRPVRAVQQVSQLPTIFNSQKLSGASMQPTADHTINARHLDALPVESGAVQSGVGTGKTAYSIQVMAAAQNGMYLTHTRQLAGQYVERAAAAGVIVEHYSEMPKSEHYRAPRLSICINTLVLYVKATGTLPPTRDLLVIDEISQFIEQILVGGTMEGDELHIADQVVRHLLSNARRVLVMDAHISPAALDYVRKARTGLPLVVNTYKTPRGELYIAEKRSRATGEALRAAMEGKRVAVASFGVTSGQAIADQIASVIDDPARVLFVHADNSGEERQAAFLRNPDGEAGKYQAIIYSPVIGTGYSIETPFDVLVALAGQEQSAEDVRQFIGRFRNVTKTYAWLPNNQDTRETDAQALTDRLIAAAERTAHPFVADGRLQRAISPQARQFVEFHAAVRTARNASMNNLRLRFASLCAGSYTIRALDGDDQTTAALINARMTEIDDIRRALALHAPPVDADAYKRKQDTGRVTETEHAGHIRWQIEAMTGLQISPELRDRLWTEHRRKAAQRFADLLDDVTALQLADMEQAQDDTPLHRRHHRTPRRYVTEAFLRPLVDDGQPVEYSAAELEALYRPIIEHHAEALRLYFGWYSYRVNTAAGIIRLVLRRLGLTLSSDRRRVDGDRVKFYRLDVTDYCAAVEIARAIVAQRQIERAADLAEKVGLPVPKLQTPLYSRSFAVLGQHLLPPIPEPGATGWAAHPALFNQRMAALTAPIGAQA